MEGMAFMAFFYFLSLALYMTIVVLGCVRKLSDENSEFPAGKSERYFVVENKYGVDVCPICLEEFDEDSFCKVLKCGHLFHCECVNEWFASVVALCPLCQHSSE